NGDLEEEPAPTTGETSTPPASKTAKQLAARRNQERVKSILLLAIPDEYLLKFHNVADAKSLWEIPETVKCREIKINNLNLELEKAIKERDELKNKIAKWEESTKNLEEILKSQMSARDKTGLGYSTQLNELSSNHETDSETSFSVFDGRSSDEESTPANDRSSKADGYKAILPPITRNFLTPRANISFVGLDEYAIRNKIIESQTSKLNNKTSETTCQINDANTVKPKSANDEEEVSKVQKVRPENQTVMTRDDKSGQNSQKQGVGFRKVKTCFVCRSTEHLIKDCNFHDKKSQESKLKNVVNTGKREGKPVWDNTKRVNHQNFSKYPHLSETFVPSGVLTKTGLHSPSASTASPSINTARPVCTARPSINTVRPNVSTASPSINTTRPVCTARPSINTVRLNVSTVRPSVSTARPVYERPRGSCSPIKRAVVNTVKGKLDTDLKKSRWVWRPKGNYLDHVSKDNGSFMLKKIEAIQRSYELKFNLFSVSQMCDKKIVSFLLSLNALSCLLSFKLLDESQVVLRAPRKDDVYNLDLKNIVPSEGLEKQLNHNVKIIRCDNGTEFKNHAMNELCAKKGIKREFSVARTPQQNGVMV
ncbi:ribonuclease H-like domain-containing protein, partial [Tanacetum coccineum]